MAAGNGGLEWPGLGPPRPGHSESESNVTVTPRRA